MTDSPQSPNRASNQRVIRWLVVAGIAFYLSLFLANSLTRTRHFAPDSMNYTDVARNIAAGKGIVQSTLGYNQTFLFDETSRIPTPFTSQAPLYPVMIALLCRLGLPCTDGALLIPVIACASILLLAYLLARDLYGDGAAVLSLAFLIGYFPLTRAARWALTDALGAALLLLFLLLLVKSSRYERTVGRPAGIRWFLAGLAAGLAFGTRYGLLPMVFLGILFLASERRGMRPAPRFLLYLIGAAVPTGLVLGHNLSAAGYLLPPMLPSDSPLRANLRDTAFSLFGSYIQIGDGAAQATVALAVAAACLVAMRTQRRTREVLGLFVRDRRYLLTLWFLLYSGFVVYLRTSSHLDIITSRMMLPAGVIVVVLGAALVAKTLERWMQSRYVLRGILIAVILWVCFREARIIVAQPILDANAGIAESDRLTWIANNTTDRDLVIGDDAADVPFYFPGQGAVSFSAYPYNIYLTYETLTRFTSSHCSRYRDIYLILRLDDDLEYDEQLYHHGQFITDLRRDRIPNAYPDIVPIIRLKDASVFRVLCDQPNRSRDADWGTG